MHSTYRWFTVGLFLFSANSAFADPASDQFFESRIRPLLIEHCLGCHGPQKQKSDLRLDSFEGTRKGGSSGFTLLGEKTEKGITGSRLLNVIRHEKDSPQMPPKGKLSDRQIEDITRWITIGAPYPVARTNPKADPNQVHWAFRAVGKPPLPTVTNTSWAKTDLDRFILAKLEQAGLHAAPPADRRTLIRRATFDLTGLPPTPEEIDAFLKDTAADAYARLIERLLASPAYGEHWGRHWLDVARYADSNGLDENVAHGNAWRYRDYVVNAFNTDKPYRQFLLEQVAGDLLPAKNEPSRHEQLIATGFLVLGPKVLAEPDEQKMILDIVDEQMDTLGRAVMGMTLNCARCHDHKFDPITAEDYYALAGIFTSSRTMESLKRIAKWNEHIIGSPEEIKRKNETDAAIVKLKEQIKVLQSKKEESAKVELKSVQAKLAALEKEAFEVPSAMGIAEGAVADTPLLRRGNHLSPGKPVSRGVPKVLAVSHQVTIPQNQSGRLELANWLVSPNHPLTARVMVNRIWRWHFGRGIVASTDNFGLLGEKPSHPELLDWLATRFVESGWSIKAMHRTIMLSSTYQMSSTPPELALSKDPDNRLISRFPSRRLEAESIRDSLLAVSGLLDRSRGGPALTHVKNREFLFDHTSKDKTSYEINRRSLYLPVIRNNLYDVYQLFDTTDAAVGSGDRATTTVATQALFWMNSELVHRASAALAKKILSGESRDDSARIRVLYRTLYGREPSESEISRATRALSEFQQAMKSQEPDPEKRRLRSWSIVCQSLLSANEFIYVN